MEVTAYESFAKGHGTTVAQARDRFKMFTENAKTEGLVYNYDIIQMTNTLDAHQLAKWANQFGKEDEITNRLMKAYFTEGMNLADHQVLANLAEEIGLNPEEALSILKNNTYKNQVIAEQTEARQIGVQGVPFFVLNRKYGISGAQQKEYFVQALNKIWEEENPLQTLNNQDTSQSCDHDECGIDEN